MDSRIRFRASVLPLVRHAVTDQRILVWKAGAIRPTLVRGIVRELPREIRIGEPYGFWWRCDSLGELLYVHRKFHHEVRRADYELPAGLPHA